MRPTTLCLRPTSARQRQDRGPAAGCQQQAHDQAERGTPVGERHQHHGMEDQQQIERRQPAVGLEEPAVGKAFDQSQHDQQGRPIERPFADRFGQPALALQQAGQAFLGLPGAAPRRTLQPAEADQPLGDLCPAPVDHRQHQAGDAQPFVQAVGLVEPVEQRLHAHRACGEEDRHAHCPHHQYAAEMNHGRAQGPELERLDQQVIGHQPERDQRGEQPDKGQFDGFHRASSRKVPYGSCASMRLR